jgi:hypothetical protein
MRNKNPFIPLHEEELKGPSYQSIFTIEFHVPYRVYTLDDKTKKFKQFDTYRRFFMWSGEREALLVAIHEPYMVCRMCNYFNKACPPSNIGGRVFVKLYKNQRSTDEQLYIRKVGA